MNLKPAPIMVMLLLSLISSGWTQSALTDTGPAKWEPDIQAFEACDLLQPLPKGGTLFVGSSFIRLWKTLSEDFPEAAPINRGFGGCEMADVLHYADRIIIPYRPRRIFVYAGDNDLANGKTPEQVVSDFKQMVARVHASLPEVRVVFIAIKPSPARWGLVEKVRKANEGAKGLATADGKVAYADVFTPMLGDDGTPRKELFIEDGLHLNSHGYALWRDILRPYVE